MSLPSSRFRQPAAWLLAALALPAWAADSLLNVSYDVTRELYKHINPAFVSHWSSTQQQQITINQSHGGSTRQSQAVAAGLAADVVTMNQSPDIDSLVRSRLVRADWRQAFPHEAAPYTTVTVFIVRKGNPKRIRDWNDLVRPDVRLVIPNPKTSGNGRYTYLAAWGYALKQGGDEAQAKQFVKRLFDNVPVLDGGDRGATTTFAQRGIGDALVTFENEAALLLREFGSDRFEIVYPSVSVEAAAPVALVERVVDRRKSRPLAKAYLDFLFSPAGQTIIAEQGFRPRDPAIFARFASQFPPLNTFSVETFLGGWDNVQRQHFADGALYDQLFKR